MILTVVVKDKTGRQTDSPIQHDYAQVGEVRLHYARCGDGERLVLLLHGFPECWYSWRRQLIAVGEQYTVVAPDLRGYNLSDKPKRVKDYVIEKLIADVVGLMDHFEAKQAAVVGHDWGAAVAWAVGLRRPERVWKLAAMQVPPPKAWRDNATLEQLRRSWYMFYFQIPRRPERWMSRDNFAMLERMFRSNITRQDTFTAEDIAVYKEALQRPGALTSAINYYRANLWSSLRARDSRRISVPTLFIYGEKDRFVIPETAQNVGRYIDAPYREVRIPHSGHWVQNEAIDEVNNALLEFLADDSGTDNGSQEQAAR